MSKIWEALKAAELGREPALAADVPSAAPHLSTAQQAALCALLAHGSLQAAAAACGLSAAALEGWLRTPTFVAAYHAACRAARAQR